MRSLCQYAQKYGFHIIEGNIPSELIRSNSETNPSCVYFNDELIVSFRAVNYVKIFLVPEYDIFTTNKNQDYIQDSSYGIRSYNIVGKLSNDNIVDYKLMNEPYGYENSLYMGLEDVRLVKWNNKIYAYGTRWDVEMNIGHICIYELNDKQQACNEIIVKSPKNSTCEKNWCAIEDKPFHFIYYNNPVTIVRVDPKTGDSYITNEKEYMDNVPDNIRGNTPIVRYDSEKYIAILHTTDYNYDNDNIIINYNFYLVTYDNDLNITYISKPFSFNQNISEFCCGMAINGNDVYIAFSELDASGSIMKIGKEQLMEFATNYDCEDEVNFLDFYNRANKYFNKDKLGKSIAFYNYSLIGLENHEYRFKAFIAYLSYYIYIIMQLPGGAVDKYIKTVDKLISEYPDSYELEYFKKIIVMGNNSFEKNKPIRKLTKEFDAFINKDYIK